MNIINEDLSPEVTKINEMFVSVQPSLDPRITNSVYYVKLKQLMFAEIVKFTKEKLELRQDLLNLRVYIGDYLSEEDIRKYLDEMKSKYTDNIGIEYHIESTRLDYGVCVFCIIKRDNIYCKKFIFRFRKNPGIGLDMSNVNDGGNLYPDKEKISNDINELIGGNNNV